ncbi:MAG: calcium-binding protein, partial [Hormoscilla sp.]
AVFTVTLSEASDTEVTVEYATTGETASASGGDYVRTDGTLTFAPGETSGTITVEVLGDNVSEDDETFFVNLDNVSDNAIIADGQGEATIADDDGPPMPPQIVDVIQGTSLEDTLDGTPQNNVLIGLAGDDIVNAIGGEDLLFGGSGDDNLDGGMGDDLIYGGDGNDLIFGGSGNDTLIGEAGQDFMLGGSGSDIFVLSQDFATPILAQADAIVDFNVEEDAIGLDVGLTRDDIILEGLGTNTAITLAEDNSILAIVNRVTPDQLTDDNFQSVNIGLF